MGGDQEENRRTRGEWEREEEHGRGGCKTTRTGPKVERDRRRGGKSSSQQRAGAGDTRYGSCPICLAGPSKTEERNEGKRKEERRKKGGETGWVANGQARVAPHPARQ